MKYIGHVGTGIGGGRMSEPLTLYRSCEFFYAELKLSHNLIVNIDGCVYLRYGAAFMFVRDRQKGLLDQ
ncbi:hypothetical protein V2J09_021395 [Rumex salicifolius]